MADIINYISREDISFEFTYQGRDSGQGWPLEKGDRLTCIKAAPTNGQIVLIDIGGNLFVRRYMRTKNKIQLWIGIEEPLMLVDGDDFKILGVISKLERTL